MADDIFAYDFFLHDNPHKPSANEPSVRSSRGNAGLDRVQAQRQRDVYAQDDANSYNYTSVAPDILSYREEAPLPEVHHAPAEPMNRTAPKRASVVKIALIAASGLLLILTVLYGQVQTNRMYQQISEKKHALDIVQSENVRLDSERQSKVSQKNIEDYAAKMGLHKIDNSQIKCVQTQTDDTVKILEEDKSLYRKIMDVFGGIVEYIFG